MAILNCTCNCITQLQIQASSNDKPPLPPRPIPGPVIQPDKIRNQSYRKLQDRVKQKQGQQQQQPSVAEIERAIGAGVFRDRDIDSESEEKRSLFENVIRNTVGEKEGSVEKKLRETGEWLVDRSENNSGSAGKNILVIMFVWGIPMWIVAFLIASGILELPFDSPFLQDLIS